MADDGLVIELQKDCLNSAVPVSTILRRAKVIAAKLGLDDLNAWLAAEINGYECAPSELPSHRKGIGSPKFKNPYHGWCPIMTDGGALGNALRTVFLMQPVAELEELASGGDGSSSLIMYYSPEIEALINESLPGRMECGLHFARSQITNALDFVRNKTLDWTLELERHGITGSGYSFGGEQKREAKMVTNNIYGGNVGVLGSVAGNTHNTDFYSVAGDLNIKRVSELAAQIRETLPALPESSRGQIDSALRQIDAESVDTEASRSKVAKAFSSIRNILEGAAGNLAATGVLSAISAVGF